MTSKNFPLSRKDELVIQELKDEILIYDLRENKAYCLNKTSALIWQLCDGNKSVAEISQSISKKLKSLANEDFVWFALDQLKKDNLLSNSEELNINFNGLSRREVIRKVGFASMVALPVISSLVAPTAAMAQSAGAGLQFPSGAVCGSSAHCASAICSGICIGSGMPCTGFGTSCPAFGTCLGAARCTTGGSCSTPGTPCFGPAGPGTCNFSGICSARGAAPCSTPGPCEGVGFCGVNHCA